MGALPALDVFIITWSYEYIENLVTFKVQITLDIDCKQKLNLLFKTMLKFLNKHVSGILAGGTLFWPPTKTGLYVPLGRRMSPASTPNRMTFR